MKTSLNFIITLFLLLPTFKMSYSQTFQTLLTGDISPRERFHSGGIKLRGAAGMTVIDGEKYLTVRLQPEFLFGPSGDFGAAFDTPFYF